MRSLALLLTLLAIFLSASTAHAQAELDRTPSLLTFNVSWNSTKLQDYDTTIDGGAAGISWETVLGPTMPLSLGATAGYLGAEQEFQYEGQTIKAEYSAFTFQVTGRYFFLKNRFLPYVGLGMGLSFGTLEDANASPAVGESSTEFLFSVPLGVYIFLSKVIYVNVNYVPYRLDGDQIDGFSHGVTLGIGIQSTGQ